MHYSSTHVRQGRRLLSTYRKRQAVESRTLFSTASIPSLSLSRTHITDHTHLWPVRQSKGAHTTHTASSKLSKVGPCITTPICVPPHSADLKGPSSATQQRTDISSHRIVASATRGADIVDTARGRLWKVGPCTTPTIPHRAYRKRQAVESRTLPAPLPDRARA
jgi:hypothetical protein